MANDNTQDQPPEPDPENGRDPSNADQSADDSDDQSLFFKMLGFFKLADKKKKNKKQPSPKDQRRAARESASGAARRPDSVTKDAKPKTPKTPPAAEINPELMATRADDDSIKGDSIKSPRRTQSERWTRQQPKREDKKSWKEATKPSAVNRPVNPFLFPATQPAADLDDSLITPVDKKNEELDQDEIQEIRKVPRAVSDEFDRLASQLPDLGKGSPKPEKPIKAPAILPELPPEPSPELPPEVLEPADLEALDNMSLEDLGDLPADISLDEKTGQFEKPASVKAEALAQQDGEAELVEAASDKSDEAQQLVRAEDNETAAAASEADPAVENASIVGERGTTEQLNLEMPPAASGLTFGRSPESTLADETPTVAVERLEPETLASDKATESESTATPIGAKAASSDLATESTATIEAADSEDQSSEDAPAVDVMADLDDLPLAYGLDIASLAVVDPERVLLHWDLDPQKLPGRVLLAFVLEQRLQSGSDAKDLSRSDWEKIEFVPLGRRFFGDYYIATESGVEYRVKLGYLAGPTFVSKITTNAVQTPTIKPRFAEFSVWKRKPKPKVEIVQTANQELVALVEESPDWEQDPAARPLEPAPLAPESKPLNTLPSVPFSEAEVALPDPEADPTAIQSARVSADGSPGSDVYHPFNPETLGNFESELSQSDSRTWSVVGRLPTAVPESIATTPADANVRISESELRAAMSSDADFAGDFAQYDWDLVDESQRRWRLVREFEADGEQVFEFAPVENEEVIQLPSVRWFSSSDFGLIPGPAWRSSKPGSERRLWPMPRLSGPARVAASFHGTLRPIALNCSQSELGSHS